MVQKEAAVRICAEVGSRDAGAVSVAVSYYAEAKKMLDVSKGSFMPQPKVDSAVIRLTLRDKPPVTVENEEHFFKIVKAVFSQRRKTAANCLSNSLGVSKEQAGEALKKIGRNEKERAESFSIEELAELSKYI